MKTITKIFIALILGVVFALGAFPHIAHADEVSLVPLDSFEYTAKSSYSNYTSPVYMELERNAWNSPFNSDTFCLGYRDYIDSPSDGVFLYPTSGTVSQNGIQVARCAYEYQGKNIQDFSITPQAFVIALDMSDNLNGYYRYECDFEYGVGFVIDPFQYTTAPADLSPSYIYNSAPLHIPDSDTGMHISVYLVGEDVFVQGMRTGDYTQVTNALVHLHAVSTFYYDSTYGTEVTFDLSPVFSNMVGTLTYDMAPVRNTGRSQTAQAFYNNRVWSALYGNVEPPVTPTPTVTPYPGQDTQESINAGVQQIVQGLDVQATPIPQPDDLTIDETLFDMLESMTLPDVSPAEQTFTSLWTIFDPLWAFIGLMAGSMLVVGVYMYCLRGRFI